MRIERVLSLIVALVLASASALAQQIEWRQCPLNGHLYGAVNAQMGWNASEALAVSNGGHLATVRSQTEQEWIAATFQQQLSFNGFWVGLRDIANEGTWAWSSGEPLTYSNWAPGEPNGAQGENWAHLVGTTANPPFQWTWNDNSEAAQQIHPLIEIVPPAPLIAWRKSPINRHWYGAATFGASWNEGEALALSLGGHLATIRSQAEQDWIASTFQPQLSFNGFWVGLRDVASEGTWLWSSGEPLTYSNWAPGEPNGAQGENWMHLVGTTANPPFQWTWNDNSEAAVLIHPLVETLLPPTLDGAQFCFGDNMDPNVTTPCPCGNFGGVGHGCANSIDTNGGLLVATGTTNPDTVEFTASGLPPTALTIFLKGDVEVAAGVVFGDGVRCAGGSLLRFGQQNAVDGVAVYPGSFPNTVSVAGGTPPGSGLTGYYQASYRNAAEAFCPPATFNVTNGIELTW